MFPNPVPWPAPHQATPEPVRPASLQLEREGALVGPPRASSTLVLCAAPRAGDWA